MMSRAKRANPRDHIRRRDSKVSHEIEASGQPFQDGAQALRSNSIQKELTRSVYVVSTLNATEGYVLDYTYTKCPGRANKQMHNCQLRELFIRT